MRGFCFQSYIRQCMKLISIHFYSSDCVPLIAEISFRLDATLFFAMYVL
jgi:hypothetical protein